MNVVVALILALALLDAAYAQKREEVEIRLGDGRSLTGVFYTPESALPAPAVIVLHTHTGQ
jgi:hypothetical protein